MTKDRLSIFSISSAVETTRVFGVVRNHLHAEPEVALKLALELLNHLGASLPKQAEAILLVALAQYELGNLKAAKEQALAALVVWEAGEYPSQRLETLLLLGRVCRDLSELEEAEDYLKRGLELAKTNQDSETEAKALNQLAGFCGMQGKLLEALGYLEQALERFRQCDNLKGQANVLNNLGILYSKIGDYPLALEYGFEALQLCLTKDLGVRLELMCLNNIGLVYEETQDYPKAIEYYLQARKRSIEQGLFAIQLSTTLNVGLIHLKQEDLDQSRWFFAEGLDLSRQVGSKADEVAALEGLGRVALHQQDLYTALDYFQQAYVLAIEIADSEQQNKLLLQLGRAKLVLGDFVVALEYSQQALELAQQLGQKKMLARAHGLLADGCAALGDFQKSNQHLREAFRLERELLNQETEQKNRSLSHKFELERVRSEELERNQSEMVYRLALAAEYRDDNTGEHIQRVGSTSAQIARELGWPKAKVELLRQAATLHDIGKIAISDLILLKPGKLTPEEYEVIKTHTRLGAEMLVDGRSELLRMAEEIARTHHERWDGKGYPKGLMGDAIPESGRIVAVADVLDALTSERPYKRAWTLSEALEEIQRNADTQFDARVVAACVRVLGKQNQM